jgi:hypothetical protein
MVFEPCVPDERSTFTIPGDGGFTVSYYLQNCAIIGGALEEGVYAERPHVLWPWRERKYIFQHPVNAYIVNVVPTGQNTVTLSTEGLSKVFLAEKNWGTLKINYNIGSIDEPRPADPATTGSAWAENQRRLEQHARSQGTRLIRELFPE